MQHIPKFSFLYVVSFIVYLFAAFSILKISSSEEDKRSSGKILWTILVFSLIFRLSLLPLTPSNDMFRYVWEGRLQLNGLNPYSYPPESSNLEQLRDRFFSGIGHKHLTTIYPPLTLMMFVVAELFSHSFMSMKIVFLTFDVLSIFLLVKLLRMTGKGPVHFLIFCLSLGSPFISKIITIIIFCSVIFCFYKKHLQKNPIEITLDTDTTIIKYSYMSIGAFLILAPTVHPWYLTWIVPFLCFYHNRAWLVLTGTVVFYYFMNYPLFSKLIEYNNEWVWQEVHWLKLPEYLPFYFLLLYGFPRKHLLTDEYVTI